MQNHKRSIGKLRTAVRTKPKSPNLTGKLSLQRSTMTELARQFRETREDQIECNIAGWFNVDVTGSYITVEISPLFKPTPPPSSLVEFFYGGPKDDEDDQ
jgi:hypothetical protein